MISHTFWWTFLPRSSLCFVELILHLTRRLTRCRYRTGVESRLLGPPPLSPPSTIVMECLLAHSGHSLTQPLVNRAICPPLLSYSTQLPRPYRSVLEAVAATFYSHQGRRLQRTCQRIKQLNGFIYLLIEKWTLPLGRAITGPVLSALAAIKRASLTVLFWHHI